MPRSSSNALGVSREEEFSLLFFEDPDKIVVGRNVGDERGWLNFFGRASERGPGPGQISLPEESHGLVPNQVEVRREPGTGPGRITSRACG